MLLRMILIEVVIGTASRTPAAPQSQPQKKIERNTTKSDRLRESPRSLGSTRMPITNWQMARERRIR